MMEEEDPESSRVVSKGPCGKCGSSDGRVTYGDGHEHCFVCGDHAGRKRQAGEGATSAGGGASRSVARGPGLGSAPGLLQPPATGAYPALKTRGLKPETLKRHGYFVTTFKGQPVHVAPYYSHESGEVVAQKIRLPNKEFVTLGEQGSIVKCRLFGHHVYGDKFDRKVVVTEGEIDAMSVAQALEYKFAAVSISTGAKGAAKSVKNNYLWLDRFDEIILWFDDDEPGRQAVAEVAALFKVGKVRIAKVPGYKDASEVLAAGKPGDIEQAIYMAAAYRPPGIVNAADQESDVLPPEKDAVNAWSYDWPWREANDMLGPIMPGQVCYHVAGTGIGKTTGIAEIEYHLIRNGCKVAHMGFEDSRRDVKLRLLSIHTESRLDLHPLPPEKMLGAHRDLFGPRMVEMFDPETAEWTVDAILGYVRYCAKALDCRVVLIDPLTFIAAGLSLGDDERRALDKASRDLAAMSKELQIHIQVAHHLKRPEGTGHEEGAPTSLNEVRGSGGIANFASFVIGHERNQQAEGEGSTITQLRVLKNRPRSVTGPMVCLAYNMGTGRLLPTSVPFPGPSRGSQRGGGGRPAPGRSPTDDF